MDLGNRQSFAAIPLGTWLVHAEAWGLPADAARAAVAAMPEAAVEVTPDISDPLTRVLDL